MPAGDPEGCAHTPAGDLPAAESLTARQAQPQKQLQIRGYLLSQHTQEERA